MRNATTFQAFSRTGIWRMCAAVASDSNNSRKSRVNHTLFSAVLSYDRLPSKINQETSFQDRCYHFFSLQGAASAILLPQVSKIIIPFYTEAQCLFQSSLVLSNLRTNMMRRIKSEGTIVTKRNQVKMIVSLLSWLQCKQSIAKLLTVRSTNELKPLVPNEKLLCTYLA